MPPAALNSDGGTGNIVRSAALSQSGGIAEIRVDLASGPLGPIQLHTTLQNGGVGAEIHVQDQAAHSLLSAGMPSLERSLQERNLQVQNLAVLQNDVGSGTGGFNRGNPDAPPQNPARNWNRTFQTAPATAAALAGMESEPIAGGLSIQA
jgi:flagellar hook-length control protein FliK